MQHSCVVDDSVKPTIELFQLFLLFLSHNYIAVFRLQLEFIIGIANQIVQTVACFGMSIYTVYNANNRFCCEYYNTIV